MKVLLIKPMEHPQAEACPRMGQTLSRKSAGERRLKIVH